MANDLSGSKSKPSSFFRDIELICLGVVLSSIVACVVLAIVYGDGPAKVAVTPAPITTREDNPIRTVAFMEEVTASAREPDVEPRDQKIPSRDDKPRGPNVLFVISDDLRDELGCYGNDHIHSPNMDRLASEGTLMRHAYCQYAICGASRASLFTGRYPDQTGVYGNDTRFRELYPNLVSLPQHFTNHGYRTKGFGKLLHNAVFDPVSWNEPRSKVLGPNYASPRYKRGWQGNKTDPRPVFESPDVPDAAYQDGKTAQAAVSTIDRFGKTGEPFFMMVGFYNPHSPFNAPKKYWDLYDPSKIELATNQYRPRGTHRVAVQGAPYLRSYSNVPDQGNLPDDLQRQMKHGYYACISYVDAQLGMLLDALQRNGLDENTIVVFTSDHGYQLGEHNLWCKHSNFEIATKVPMIIYDPRQKIKGNQKEEICELLDIVPTLTELCGLPELETAAGKPIDLTNSESQEEIDLKFAYSRYHRRNHDGFSIRTKKFRYNEWWDVDGNLVTRELYDHSNDPQENQNQVQNPDYKSEVKRLTRILRAKRKAVSNEDSLEREQ